MLAKLLLSWKALFSLDLLVSSQSYLELISVIESIELKTKCVKTTVIIEIHAFAEWCIHNEVSLIGFCLCLVGFMLVFVLSCLLFLFVAKLVFQS